MITSKQNRASFNRLVTGCLNVLCVCATHCLTGSYSLMFSFCFDTYFVSAVVA